MAGAAGIGKIVNEFYESYPYPCLPLQKLTDVTGKMHANVMEDILATAGLKYGDLKGKTVLDAGCGTGEKSVYFALFGARVKAFDLCNASLEIARKNAGKFNAKVDFEKADVLKYESEEMFDHVFCLGVLHHTENPRAGFERLALLVKPGGTITIGLYSAYGRLLHRFFREKIAREAGKGFEQRLEVARKKVFGREFKSAHEKAFAADKYANPHESHHTIEEVKGWMKGSGFEMTGVHPEVKGNQRLAQLQWLLGRKGFFVVSGRRIK
ncbi:Ubiquinone biosynthesis O-methyltransferase [Candidatus Gugararchaeum adminiculabundum]|nr:Ubiquinone biosynthesis O-methyltransferase [Candidatus Gugararchaeum adminiculabundum]